MAHSTPPGFSLLALSAQARIMGCVCLLVPLWVGVMMIVWE